MLARSQVCPFCAQHRRLLAWGIALATPIVLCACYGLPPCADEDLRDDDGDGFPADVSCATREPSPQRDCADDDPSVNPSAAEVCGNEVDENCDFIVAGPDHPEVCGNQLDDDCDGAIDEADCGAAR